MIMMITPPVFSHTNSRFQAARDLRVSGVLSGQDYFDSVGGCANYCARLGNGQFYNYIIKINISVGFSTNW